MVTGERFNSISHLFGALLAVAAATMLITSAASIVSRKIMRADPNMVPYSAMMTPCAVA